MLRTTILTMALLCCFVISLPACAVTIANASFEDPVVTIGQIPHWTQYRTDDGSNNGVDGSAAVVTNAWYAPPLGAGHAAVRGGAQLFGDYPSGGDYDFVRTFMWSEPVNLTGFSGVEFYLTNFFTDTYHPAWGEGEAVIFNITDGTNTASIHIIDHIMIPPPYPPPFTQYGDSLVSRGDFTPNLPSTDGNLWSRFVVTASTPGFNLGSVNLANAQIGFEWEVVNYFPHAADWYQSCAIIDGVQLVVPEPGSLLLLASGLGGLLLRRRRA